MEEQINVRTFNASVEYEYTNASTGPGRIRRNMATIGAGGMFITTEEPIRAGTRLVIRFELKNRHRVIVVSRVQSTVRNKGAMIEYLNLDDEDREQIELQLPPWQPAQKKKVRSRNKK